MQPYKELFLTRQHELGIDHLLRVQCMCNYMEEAAGNHADSLGAGLSRLGKDNLAWVLAKMRLILHRRPGAGQNVRVETWPVAIERVQFRRDFIIYDAKDAILATAVTQWVVMGTLSRKLERFPLYIADMQPKNPPVAQDCGDIKIPLIKGETHPGPVFPVRLADIDQNNHVNNGRYVDFALEAADVYGGTGELRQLDIIFRSEGLRGDTIGSRTCMEEGREASFVHSLFRSVDGHELARARTVFV